MTYEEYEAAINKMVAEPETAPIAAQSLLQAIKDDGAALDAAQAAIRDRDDKIRTLQDTNIKLFLTQTGTTSDQIEEDEGPKDFAALLAEKMEA